MPEITVPVKVPKVPSSLIIEPTSVNVSDNRSIATVPLEQVSAEALAEIADQWRANLFDCAGKADPAPLPLPPPPPTNAPDFTPPPFYPMAEQMVRDAISRVWPPPKTITRSDPMDPPSQAMLDASRAAKRQRESFDRLADLAGQTWDLSSDPPSADPVRLLHPHRLVEFLSVHLSEVIEGVHAVRSPRMGAADYDLRGYLIDAAAALLVWAEDVDRSAAEAQELSE